MISKQSTFRSEKIISEEHIKHIQTFTKCVAELNSILGYNLTHNNSYREKAAVAVDQSIYPELEIIHNNHTTGADAYDKFGRTREYKKIELGHGSKNPCQRSYTKLGKIKNNMRGKDGYQPNKIKFLLSRFRNNKTQSTFLERNALIVSVFFAENALPSISYVIHGVHNLQKVVVFFNEQLHNAPNGTNNWSHNNVQIPISWILAELNAAEIDIIVMVDNKHIKLSVEEHNKYYVGADLTPSGFLINQTNK